MSQLCCNITTDRKRTSPHCHADERSTAFTAGFLLSYQVISAPLPWGKTGTNSFPWKLLALGHFVFNNKFNGLLLLTDSTDYFSKLAKKRETKDRKQRNM